MAAFDALTTGEGAVAVLQDQLVEKLLLNIQNSGFSTLAPAFSGIRAFLGYGFPPPDFHPQNITCRLLRSWRVVKDWKVSAAV